MAIKQSATLAINERLQARRAAGEPVLHLGFGEAGLPVLPELAAVLADSVRHNDYGPVVGIPAARTAAAGYFARRGLPTDPDQIVIGPGSKPLLYALMAVLPGDVILPAPSWVSYAAQAALLGKRVIGVLIPAASGGVPDPDHLRAAVATTDNPGTLILTLPDNPTGTLPSLKLLTEVCRIADEAGLVIISDEIYRDLCRTEFHSPTALLPARTIVTSGLSKSLALGGYRIGFTRIPTELRTVGADLVGVASEVWSNPAGPMQRVAAAALADPPEVTSRISASRRLHGAVTTEVHRMLIEADIRCRPPQGGFYLYPDFEPHRETLAAQGIHTGQALADTLLARHGVGVLAGDAFGDDPAALRFRVATSLMYGQTDEQKLASLTSDQPLALPWIAEGLAHLAKALADVTRAG